MQNMDNNVQETNGRNPEENTSNEGSSSISNRKKKTISVPVDPQQQEDQNAQAQNIVRAQSSNNFQPMPTKDQIANKKTFSALLEKFDEGTGTGFKEKDGKYVYYENNEEQKIWANPKEKDTLHTSNKPKDIRKAFELLKGLGHTTFTVELKDEKEQKKFLEAAESLGIEPSAIKFSEGSKKQSLPSDFPMPSFGQ